MNAPTKDNIVAILGHEPTPPVMDLLVSMSEYVERKHAKNPEIPKSVYWNDILEILTERIKRDEG